MPIKFQLIQITAKTEKFAVEKKKVNCSNSNTVTLILIREQPVQSNVRTDAVLKECIIIVHPLLEQERGRHVL